MTSAAARSTAAAPHAIAGEAALTRWLLTGPAQCGEGRHAGAVAGCIDADGRARYVYPEITGYYLHWLAAQAASRGNDRALTVRAAAAQAWLARWLASAAPPPTRVYLDGSDTDWRNGALFFFDVAMAIRGLAAAARWRVLAPDFALVAGLNEVLRGLVGRDGIFDACVSAPGREALPARWSTRRGGFLAKAAAGVLTAHEDLPGIDADVAAAAATTYGAALDAALATPHPEVHPLLYTFEGILSLPRHPRFPAMLARIADQFDALLEHSREAGHVPETLAPHDGGAQRTDVLAQALRVGHLIALHRPDRAPDRVALARLRHLLQERVAPEGAVAFAPDAPAGERNVWATMFTEQALALFAPGRELPADAGRLLI